MIYRLIIITGPLKGQRVTIDPEPMTIGRDPGCALVLPDDEAALQHAVIEHRDDGLFIRDLGSMHKLIVNKREVTESRIKHGDTLEIGRTRFLVQAVVKAEVNPPPATLVEELPPRRTRRNLAVLLAAAAVIAFVVWPRAATDPDPVNEPDEPFSTAAIDPLPPEAPSPLPEPEPELDPEPEAFDPYSSELARLRDDLRSMRSVIETLASETNPAPDFIGPPAPAPPSLNESEVILASARAAMEADEPSEAEAMLLHLQGQSPDYLPAYEALAALYEAWGKPGKAREQWALVMQRTTETPRYRRAVAERIRLARHRTTDLTELSEAVAIADIEAVRFPSTETYDDMRVLKIQVTAPPEIAPADLRVVATFYEQDRQTGLLQPSEATPRIDAVLQPPQHGNGSERTYTATYLAPSGYIRDTPHRRYAGYLVEVLIDDQRIARQGRPTRIETLADADQIHPDHPATQAGLIQEFPPVP